MDTVQKQGKRKACECCRQPGKTVTYICKECEEEFCEACAKKHSTKTFFKDHKPVPIAAMVCSDHKRPFTFFCQDCNRLLCFACHNRDICDGHRLEKLDSLKMMKQAAMKEIIKQICENIEANKREMQPAKMALTKELGCVKHVKQEIKQQGKKLKDQIDVQVQTLLKDVDTHEYSLHAIKQQVESDDQLVTLCKLKETAQAACNGGIEQTLLTLPTIQAALPPNPKPVNQQAFTKLLFTPQVAINVGALHMTGRTAYKTNIKSIKVWDKANVGKRVWDMVCLIKWKIVFTDIGNQAIVLMDKGQVLADSRQKGVKLHKPLGIVYHPKQDCLLVCDYIGGHVTFLHPTSLREMKKVKISGISHPVGVCVMSDGNIVVSGGGKAGGVYHPDSVGVYDIHGKLKHLQHTYNRGTDKFAGAAFVAVDNQDNILVSNCNSKKIVKLDKAGRFLCDWSTQGNPRGLTVAGDIVLVAEWNPDCMMAYSLHGGDARQVLAWNRGRKDKFSKIMALSTTPQYDLTVVGEKGLRMYRLTSK